MSARLFRKSWWVDFTVSGKRYRLKSPDNSRAGAKAYEALLRQRLARGEPLREEAQRDLTVTPPFAEFARRWFDTYVRPNNRPAGQRHKEVTLRAHLVPFFGTLPLGDIRTEGVERYKAEKRAAGLRPKSINNHLMVLGKCLRTAVDWGVLGAAPKIPLLKVPPGRVDFLSHEETSQLLGYRDELLWPDVLLFALRTGLRRGELIALDWSDVDLERRQLTVRHSCFAGIVGPTKSNKERSIPLTADLHAMLSARRDRRGRVFVRRNGEPLNDGVMQYAIKRVCRKAGIRAINWHMLRHTFASHLASEGVPIPAIQQLLGHSDIKMTMLYAHLAPSVLRDAVDVLERYHRNGSVAFGQPAGNSLPVHALWNAQVASLHA